MMIQMGWKDPREPLVCPSTLRQDPISHGEAGINPEAVPGASLDQDAGNARAMAMWQNRQPDRWHGAIATLAVNQGRSWIHALTHWLPQPTA